MGLVTGGLSGRMGQGVQLFEEPLDLPFRASGVLLQLGFRCLHPLPVIVKSGIIAATDRTRRQIRVLILCVFVCVCVCGVPVMSRLWLVSHGVTELSSFIPVFTDTAGDLMAAVHLSKRLPQLSILLFQGAQR